MDAKDIVKELQSRGFLITPEALSLILESENPRELADNMLSQEGKAVIDMDDLRPKERTKIEAAKTVEVERTFFHPVSKDIESDVRAAGDGLEETKGDLDDFVEHFRNRYERIAEMLKRRGGAVMSITNAKKRQYEDARIIGMVSEKKMTKNGHMYLKLEDEVTFIDALVPSSAPQLIAKMQQVMLDETVAVDGRMSRNLFIAKEVIQPDIEIREQKTLKDPVSIAMFSDMHVGSRLFMKDNFTNVIRWLRGEIGDEKERGAAGRVKYVTFAGDLCDGIGIFPGQEKELEITDIYGQYAALTEYIKMIPEYIHVVIAPGNHDAVRNADPQPPLPKAVVPELYEMKNVTLVGSPGTVELHGLRTLLYHGTCFADLVGNIPQASFEKPEDLMEDLLKRRHLHPFYGGKPIVPQKHDNMVIDRQPDIFHTGEAHHNGYRIYRGTVCINSGTWQLPSEYVLRLGHHATPAILPVYEADTGRIKAMHFDRPLAVEVIK